MIGSDLGATLADMTPDAASGAPSQFLTLLTRTGAALASVQPAAGWRSVAYDRAAGALTIVVESGDITGLQQVTQALAKAGLTVEPGAASTDQGRAVGSFAVRAA